MGWSLYTHVRVKNWEGYLNAKIPPEEQWVPVPQRALQLRTPRLGRGVLGITGCENQQGLHLREMEGCWRPRRGRSYCEACIWTFSLTNSLALSSSTGAAVWKALETHRAELNWLTSGKRLEGQGLGQLTLGVEVPAGTNITLLNSPLPKWQAQAGTNLSLH